jgi:hypothetical protein
MKNLFILFLSTCLIACTEISYKEPQPKGIKALTEIPKELRGKYLMEKDTVFLFEKGLRGWDKEAGKEEVLQIPSDSMVLKKYKGNYFISYRSGDLWNLRVMKVDKNGDIWLLAMQVLPTVKEQGEGIDSLSVNEKKEKTQSDDHTKKEFLTNLSKETPVIENGSDYIIDPSPRKLNRLLKKGFFETESGKPYLKKIN